MQLYNEKKVYKAFLIWTDMCTFFGFKVYINELATSAKRQCKFDEMMSIER